MTKFTKEPRCIHRHTEKEHPSCFLKGEIRKPKEIKIPKVLVLDIETAPIIVAVWNLHEQYIPPVSILNDFFILSWSAKWLFNSKVMSDVVTSEEAVAGNDSRILMSIWKLLNEASIVIAHNGKAFDIKKLNARFIINGMQTPMYYQVIDTLQVARSTFGFSSNKLDYINQLLELDKKKETNFKLWKDCINGKKSALKDMESYNRNDVLILEDAYSILRPWIKNHPNMAMYVETDRTICPTCLSENIHWEGNYATPRGIYKAFRCNSCGAIGRSSQNQLNKETRKILASR